MGDDDPCFLGQLCFEGIAFFKWRYQGGQLSEDDIWQIVDLMQNSIRTYLSVIGNFSQLFVWPNCI
jgi:hypothetical protein